MWIMMNDAFFSIVHKNCAEDELLVRARREGDIEKVFPEAEVKETKRNDYRFRAVLKRERVIEAVGNSLRKVNYGNFKDSVQDITLHNAYMNVWSDMERIQQGGAYGRFLR